MLGTIYYNRTIRKIVTTFGSLFSNLTLVRYNNDGSEQERFIVPLAYGQKEKFVQSLEGDPLQDKSIQITLPIMSFSLEGIAYDATRKLVTAGSNISINSNNQVSTVYNPVPYNFEFSLQIYVRNIEDGNQIIEQILPFFTPDYTLKLDILPNQGIIKDVPIILNDVKYIVNNEGSKDTNTRYVLWTLNFTVKGWIYGPVKNSSLIREVIVNLYDWDDSDQTKNLFLVMAPGGYGNYKTGEIIYQGNALEVAKAKATVVSWSSDSHRLQVHAIDGNFITNVPIIGVESNASWRLINYEISPIPLETIIVTPMNGANTANVSDPNFRYNISRIYYE